MKPAIRLSQEDNILVLAQSMQAGEVVGIDGTAHCLSAALGLGHKVAARKIAPGEKILKYGVPIGSATAAIEPGEHVHLHNMKSDYLPTFTLDAGREFHSAT
jgi:altronate dehydratase small subunit